MRMIFHHPLPLRPDADVASAVRPYQMVQAFRSLGYEVDTVCGYAAQRARAIAEIDRQIRQGARYAFMYAESSTEPSLLTERHHLPLRPHLDFGFWSRLKTRGIPLGLFYRDIYWRFPGYGAGLAWWKAAAAQLFYRYDLLQYRRLLDRLYLPSMAMARHVPWFNRSRMVALPPGAIERSQTRSPGHGLRLLYVGGMGAHYPMHELFRAVAALPGVELTVCTRETEWAAVRHEYPLPDSGQIRVVHRSGAELEPLLDEADLCVLCVRPQPYWDFAAPVKLYEYVGAQRPVIASRGTLAGDFVEQEGIGWAVDYGAEPIAALLRSILATPAVLRAPTEATRRVRHEHTWQSRARQAADDLAAEAR